VRLNIFFVVKLDIPVKLDIQWQSARLGYMIRASLVPGKHDRLFRDALAFISGQAHKYWLSVAPTSVYTPMCFNHLPCADFQVTQRFTGLCELFRVCIPLLLVFAKVDWLVLVNELKVCNLEMKMGNRELSDATGKRVLCNERC
jgi:hypothetical protein